MLSARVCGLARDCKSASRGRSSQRASLSGTAHPDALFELPGGGAHLETPFPAKGVERPPGVASRSVAIGGGVEDDSGTLWGRVVGGMAVPGGASPVSGVRERSPHLVHRGWSPRHGSHRAAKAGWDSPSSLLSAATQVLEAPSAPAQ